MFWYITSWDIKLVGGQSYGRMYHQFTYSNSGTPLMHQSIYGNVYVVALSISNCGNICTSVYENPNYPTYPQLITT